MTQLYLGMAMQAFIVALLLNAGSIEITPKQQFGAGMFFLLFSVLSFLKNHYFTVREK